MNIGAHVRGGGKLVPSLEAGVEIGATSIQVFVQSPRMWKPSQYAPEVLAAYREAQAAHPSVRQTFCHATYLINLASADRELYEKSVACLTSNLSVARGMAASGVVLHVGSHKGAGFDEVIKQIAEAFERALEDATPTPDGWPDCPILIENAAGAGGTVGRSLEEIAALIDACGGDERLGLCIDTQHLWASGVDYSSVVGTQSLMDDVASSVGVERLACLHLNDSKIELGGNRDRHANIGEGTIGPQGLAPLVGHPLIRELPLLLEVPGDGDGPRARDVIAARQVVATGVALYEGVASPTSVRKVVRAVKVTTATKVAATTKATKATKATKVAATTKVNKSATTTKSTPAKKAKKS
ncbi:MAG: deoxyribonuclease IV [Acidobacteriota bacterium]|nr:deoxyribonuclease IV [Acidobacteriota bacterium]